MGELSADELTDLRGDIGDTGDAQAFTDTELQRLYTRADEDYNATVLLSLRQLMGNSWKLHNYTQNASQEQRKQIFDNLKEMVKYWEGIVAKGGTKVKLLGRRYVPPVHKDKPRA
jgi:hypothetical protein